MHRITSALPCLVALAAGLGAQEAVKKGGGTLTLGQDTYRFHFDAANLAPAQPKLKLPRAFVLRGSLVPEQGPRLSFELTALEDGRIYGLKIVRKQPGAKDDGWWAATVKTKVEVQNLEAHPQGKVAIALSGPLTFTSPTKGGPTTWKGELWGTFESVPQS